jgi:hypothetical protein
MSRLSLEANNARADAVGRLLWGGWLDIYAGEMPVSTDVPITTQQRLATLRFDTPAFEQAVGGLAFARLLPDKNAHGDGMAAWFRCTRADHTSVVMDGTVGLENSDADIRLERTSIPRGCAVMIRFTLEEEGA